MFELELLRRTAEHTLIEMLQTIFMTMSVRKGAELQTTESLSPSAEIPSNMQTVVNPRGIQFQKNTDVDGNIFSIRICCFGLM